MARRTGLPAMMIVARRLCQLISNFTPVIQQIYPGNVPLHNALAAANAACSALHAEIAVTIAYGD